MPSATVTEPAAQLGLKKGTWGSGGRELEAPTDEFDTPGEQNFSQVGLEMAS